MLFLLLVFCCCFVQIAQKNGALPERIRSRWGSGYSWAANKWKNGYSYCLWVKAGNEHSYPQHINCIFFCKTRFFSVFVFLHFVVNLMEDERALQSCSTITSLSVRLCRNWCYRGWFATLEEKSRMLQEGRCAILSSTLISPKITCQHSRCSKSDVYIYKSIYTTIPCVYIFITT